MYKIKLIYFIPLLFLQLYLIFTLLIFQFGPINYNIKNAELFWSLIFLYHFCYLAGYIISYIIYIKKNNNFSCVKPNSSKSINWLFIIMALAFLNSIILQSNIWELITNPENALDNFFQSILNPGDSYTEMMNKYIETESSNKIYNIILFFISFSKIIIIPLLVFNWRKISKKVRIIAIFLSLIPVIISITHGKNKGVFDFFILYASSFILLYFYNKYNFLELKYKNRNKSIFIIIFIFFLFLIFFGNAMSQRGGNIQYIETMDPSGNIKVNNNSIIASEASFYYYTYAWLSSYVVQGYYGFSLALSKPFESTFGVGHSIFISRNIEQLFGVDIFNRTFQRKIDPIWSESAQWHSFYSYVANDLSFPGVSIICFLIAFFLAKFWLNFLKTGNVFAGSLLSIILIMIIFIPANNQIFGFLDGLSGFIWTFFLWFIYDTKSNLKLIK